MTKSETHLNFCSGDLGALNLALGSGDFSLAREKALDLEACALGMGDEALVAKAKELGALAAGNVAGKIFEGDSSENSKQPAAAFLAKFSETLLNVYGDRSNWPAEVKQSLAKLSAARGSSAFATEAAKVLNSLRLSPETYPAFEIGEALLANHGGELFAAAKSLEAFASRGIIGDKTLSFAYDFIFGNPENTLLPLYAAGRLGKLVEGLTAIGAETLGLTKVATQAFRATTGLATEAPVFVGAGKLVALGKGKNIDLNAGTFFKESFSSGLVFGALKFAGFFAQTVNAFLPATEAGKAAAFWNANLTSVAALMGVGGAERLAAGEHAENKPLFDAFVEACVVHFGLSAMMGSVSLNNVGAKIPATNKLAEQFLKHLAEMLPSAQQWPLLETTQAPRLVFEISDGAVPAPKTSPAKPATNTAPKPTKIQASAEAKQSRPLDLIKLNWDELVAPKLENITDPRVTIFAPHLSSVENIIAGSYTFYESLRLLGYNIDVVESLNDLPSRLAAFDPLVVGIAIFDPAIFNLAMDIVRQLAPNAVTLAGGIGALNLHSIVADFVITGDASLAMAAGLNKLFKNIDAGGVKGAKSQTGKKDFLETKVHRYLDTPDGRPFELEVGFSGKFFASGSDTNPSTAKTTNIEADYLAAQAAWNEKYPQHRFPLSPLQFKAATKPTVINSAEFDTLMLGATLLFEVDQIFIYTQSGCFGKCNYCAIHNEYGVRASPEKVVGIIKGIVELKKTNPSLPNVITFGDELFVQNSEWLDAVFKGIERLGSYDLDGNFIPAITLDAQTRVDNISNATLIRAKKLGFVFSFGVETFDPERAESMQKAEIGFGEKYVAHAKRVLETTAKTVAELSLHGLSGNYIDSIAIILPIVGDTPSRAIRELKNVSEFMAYLWETYGYLPKVSFLRQTPVIGDKLTDHFTGYEKAQPEFFMTQSPEDNFLQKHFPIKLGDTFGTFHAFERHRFEQNVIGSRGIYQPQDFIWPDGFLETLYGKEATAAYDEHVYMQLRDMYKNVSAYARHLQEIGDPAAREITEYVEAIEASLSKMTDAKYATLMTSGVSDKELRDLTTKRNTLFIATAFLKGLIPNMDGIFEIDRKILMDLDSANADENAKKATAQTVLQSPDMGGLVELYGIASDLDTALGAVAKLKETYSRALPVVRRLYTAELSAKLLPALIDIIGSVFNDMHGSVAAKRKELLVIAEQEKQRAIEEENLRRAQKARTRFEELASPPLETVDPNRIEYFIDDIYGSEQSTPFRPVTLDRRMFDSELGTIYNHHDHYFRPFGSWLKKLPRPENDPLMADEPRWSDFDPESGTYFKRDMRSASNARKITTDVASYSVTGGAKFTERVTLGGIEYPVTIEIKLGENGFAVEAQPITLKDGRVLIAPEIKTKSGVLLENNRVLFGDTVSVRYENDTERSQVNFELPLTLKAGDEIGDAVQFEKGTPIFFVKSKDVFWKVHSGKDAIGTTLLELLDDTGDHRTQIRYPVFMVVRNATRRTYAHEKMFTLLTGNAFTDKTGLFSHMRTLCRDRSFLLAPNQGRDHFAYLLSQFKETDDFVMEFLKSFGVDFKIYIEKGRGGSEDDMYLFQ